MSYVFPANFDSIVPISCTWKLSPIGQIFVEIALSGTGGNVKLKLFGQKIWLILANYSLTRWNKVYY